MKRAESQLKSLEENRVKICKENVVREYKFDPNAKLITILKDLKVLGQLLFKKSGSAEITQQMKTISVSKQSMRPTHLKDITVSSFSISTVYGSLALPNKQILVTDYHSNILKLIDTNQDKTISEIKVSGCPMDITMVKDNEVAVTIPGYNVSKIQFISVYRNSLSKGRDISVNGWCNGIAYNVRDQTLVASNSNPCRIQVMNMLGSVIKCLDQDSKGDDLFAMPQYVALSPDMTEVYVTDSEEHTVTLMTMNGDVKAVYRDKSLQGPYGICVNKSGVRGCVYVVGHGSHTVHQLDPVNNTFNLLLDQKDDLVNPVSISFSNSEDRMYIGMRDSTFLKVFQMK